MHLWLKPVTALIALGLACFLGSGAHAQTINFPVRDIALKNGESIEYSDVYLIAADCRSLLTATPEVEVMDGPPGVAVAIKQAMVVPRVFGCAKPVSGGKMMITANDIEEYSYTRMVVRIKYKTRSGERQFSRHINVALFP